MIRWATITDKTADAVQLKVLKASSCDGCQLHCDKPLFDIFKLKRDQFWVTKTSHQVQWINADLLFSDDRQIGHRVGLELSENYLLKSTFLVYILPLLLSFISMLAGQWAFVQMELAADLGALLGFVGGFVTYYFWMQIKGSSKNLPKVTFL